MEKNRRKKSKTASGLILALIFTIASTGLFAQETLTLDKALEYAETGSPDLQKTKLSLVRSQKNLEAQRAGLKSKFSLTANPIGYSNTRVFDDYYSEWYTTQSFSTSSTFSVQQPILFTNGTLSLTNTFGWQNRNSQSIGMGGVVTDRINKSFKNDLSLRLNQPLFTYNALKMDLKMLELDLENANINYALQRLNLEKSVTQYFYNVYMAQENLKIAKDELANTEASYNIIKNKVDGGLSAKEELYQAELNLATSKSSLQNSEVSYENAKDQLKLYLGMDLSKDIQVLADLQANPVPVQLEKATEHALSSRMEIRQREITIEDNLFTMIQTKASNEFKGSLSLAVGITGDNESFTQIFDNPTNSPQVSLSFNIPIFDWGQKKAKIAAQEATNKTAEINLTEQKRQIIIDIRKSYRNLQNQLNQIDIAKQNETNAQLTYEINNERYKNGDLTGMDLNLYQTQLSQKKTSYSQALINYKIELLNFKIQTLYDFANNQPIVPSELYSK
jgi:outer membrane protein TolC